MKHIERIRRALALVILACFFLPLCQCTIKAPVSDAPGAVMISSTEIFVPFQRIRLQEVNEIPLIIMFVWPLCFVALFRGKQSKRKAALISGIEFLCGLASVIYLGLILKLWGEPRYGGVIAMLAFVASTIISGGVVLRHVWLKR